MGERKEATTGAPDSEDDARREAPETARPADVGRGALRLLHDVSTRLTRADEIGDLYEAILDAAVEAMRADHASPPHVRRGRRWPAPAGLARAHAAGVLLLAAGRSCLGADGATHRGGRRAARCLGRGERGPAHVPRGRHPRVPGDAAFVADGRAARGAGDALAREARAVRGGAPRPRRAGAAGGRSRRSHAGEGGAARAGRRTPRDARPVGADVLGGSARRRRGPRLAELEGLHGPDVRGDDGLRLGERDPPGRPRVLTAAVGGDDGVEAVHERVRPAPQPWRRLALDQRAREPGVRSGRACPEMGRGERRHLRAEGGGAGAPRERGAAGVPAPVHGCAAAAA